jgi:WD40 repeat protein
MVARLLIVALCLCPTANPLCRAQQPRISLKADEGLESLAFSPDGKMLAAGCLDKVQLWEVASGKLRATLVPHDEEYPSHPRGVTFSPDGRHLAATDSGTIILWDLRTGKRRTILTSHKSGTAAIAFSPDSTRLASGGPDGKVKLWDVASARLLLTCGEHSKEVTSVAFRPDGKALVTAGRDGTIRLWDTATGEEKALVRFVDDILTVAFSPDGTVLAAGMVSEKGRLSSSSTLKELRSFRWQGFPDDDGNVSYNQGLCFSPDGKHLAACGSHFFGEPKEQVWIGEVATARQIARWKSEGSTSWSVAFSPDGGLLATSRWDGTVRLWDVATVLKAKK